MRTPVSSTGQGFFAPGFGADREVRPQIEFSLRRITSPDDPAGQGFIEVYRAAFSEPPYLEDFPAEWIRREVWEPNIRNLLLVAECGGRVIGLGCAQAPGARGLNSSAIGFLRQIPDLPFDPEKTIYISELAVAAEARNGGIGSALTRATLEWGRAGGFENFVLRTAAQGSNSIRLYRRFGAQELRSIQQVDKAEGGEIATAAKERLYLWGSLQIDQSLKGENMPKLELNLAQCLFGPQSIIQDCYPGGNRTYLVYSPQIKREQYAEANTLIMKRYPAFEQGGFIEESENEKAVCSLQMAGGEFCGNALRSLAALVAQDFLGERRLAAVCRYELIDRDSGGLSFPLEVSGSSRILSAQVVPGDTGFQVRVEIPVQLESGSVMQARLLLEGRDIACTLVRLEGISQVLLADEDLPFDPDLKRSRDRLAEAVLQLGLENEAAVGLVWVKREGGLYAIDPVVWVRKVKTCFYETACGSATVALALARAVRDGYAGLKMKVLQPSKSVIQAEVLAEQQGPAAWLSGPVEIEGCLNPPLETYDNRGGSYA